MAGSVRRQLILYFVLFALALGSLFGGFTLLVFHRVEDRMNERRLQQLVEGAHSETSVSYVGPPADAPRDLARRLEGLEPGKYEWEDEDRELHVLLSVDEGGQRTVAILGFPESESTETRFRIALAFGVVLTTLVALLLARYLALRIVSPIERLTERLEIGSLDTVVPADLASELRHDEIGTLARTLQRAGQALTASAERERRFLREASHELRTPITVIQGVSDLLRESIATTDTVTHQRLERLDRGLRRMNTSVLSLLAMARAERRLTVREMPPFRQQLEDLIDEARALAHPGVEVSCELVEEPAASLASSMLIVALSNLARNAAQHTAEGTVHVRIDALKATVSDSGPGLPPRLLEQLRSSGPQPDIGIGLATVQRICKRFGWHLEINCPERGGTVASIGLKA